MKKSSFILYTIVIFLLILICLLSMFVRNYFGAIDLEQIIFHIFIPLKGVGGNFMEVALQYIVSRLALFIIVYLLFFYILSNLVIIFKIKLFKYTININLNKIVYFLRWYIILMVSTVNIYSLNQNFNLYENIKYNFSKNNIYEKNYIAPKNVNILFPDKKRNLVYIMVESLESTETSEKNGGYRKDSVIPELEKLAISNINFSQNKKIGGFYQTQGTGFTIGAMIAQTAGVPLNSIGGIGVHDYNNYNNFMKGAVSLGEILQLNSYKNYFMMGSSKIFAGRGDYLEQHGNYEIFDLDTAKELEYIENDYNNNWWGFEDKKLFEYAKIKLKEISKNDEPFNFSLLTVDTHPMDGYLDETCIVKQNLTQYENVFTCQSKMVNDFVNWIKKQSFYKNTTIIIVGDHLNMTKEGIHEEMPKKFDRAIYNLIINSPTKTDCEKERIFTTFDMYPTTIVALGASIEGDRLALGTNLFSCNKTLAEELGLEYLQEELKKKSSFYNNCLFYGKC